MEGSGKDVGSRLTGIVRFGIPSRKSLRNRLGERYFIPVAPGLFAVPFFANNFFKQILRSIQVVVPLLFARHRIIFFAVLIFICPAGEVNAVPVYQKHRGPLRYSVQSAGACGDSYGYNCVDLSCPWWANSNLNEAGSIEWIYNRLENQYSFLDCTFYGISGGNYLLRPVCYPGGLGLRYYYRLKYPGGNIFYVTNVTAYISTIYVKPRGPYDTVTQTIPFGGIGPEYPPARLREIPVWVVPICCKNMETEAIPELSSLMLFGFAALQILMIRRIAGD